MSNIDQLLRDAEKQLAFTLQLASSEARLDAQLLMRFALGNVSRAWLMAHGDEPFNNDALQANNHAPFQALLQRRLAGEPIAYILGSREFYGLELTVTPTTLIPRSDTETLVESALAKLPLEQACQMLDLGTGSGAIALAIARHRPYAQVTAVDASPAALEVAMANAVRLGIKNISFLCSDWFSALGEHKFDIIVSNPPYIAEQDEHLQRGDLRFEPRAALTSGADGLDDIRRIIQRAPQHLNASGWLLLEHGYNQAEPVAQLLQQAGLSDIDHQCDLAGIARISMARSE